MANAFPTPHDLDKSLVQQVLADISRHMSSKKPEAHILGRTTKCRKFSDMAKGLSNEQRAEISQSLMAAGWRVEWSWGTLFVSFPAKTTAPAPKHSDLEF